MKPAYILLLILIFTFKFSLFSQNIDIIITPRKYPGWSGSVRNIDGKYNKFDGSIKIGKGSFYSFFRGYAVFDVSKIPDDADIKSIKLHLIIKEPSQLFINTIQIIKLSVDPRISNAENLYNAFNSGVSIAPEGDYLTQPGEHVVEMNNYSKDILKSQLKEDWWAIGFRQINDGKKHNRTVGVFEGYNFPDSISPYCLVTYNLKSIKSLYKDRKITYTKELRFKNKNITIQIWDHRIVDGDIISIYLNGTPILSKYYLLKNKKKISATLETGRPNDFFLFAHNVGQNPPNTVTIEITDGEIKESFILTSNLRKCEAVLIYVD